MIRTVSRFFALAAAVAAASAAAQEAPPPDELPAEEAPADDAGPVTGQGTDFTAEVSLLTDYRFRGVSRSDEDPAVSATLGMVHDSGLYAGIRATSIDGRDDFRSRNPAFGSLGDAQVDLYAGIGGPLGQGWDYDAGVQYYWFAGGAGATDYVEPYASISYLIGPLSATAGAKYAPSQRALGGEDMLYLFGRVDVAIPFRPWRFSATVGHQDWGLYGDYWTWGIGVEHQLRVSGLPDTTLGLSYVDTNLSGAPGADAGLIASLRLTF